MPFKTYDQMRQYQATWMWRRRQSWILENGPCAWCGSRQDLRVVYKNPADKVVRIPAIWSRRDEVRKELLALCMVLCSSCAKQKRRDEYQANAKNATQPTFVRGNDTIDRLAADPLITDHVQVAETGPLVTRQAEQPGT